MLFEVILFIVATIATLISIIFSINQIKRQRTKSAKNNISRNQLIAFSTIISITLTIAIIFVTISFYIKPANNTSPTPTLSPTPILIPITKNLDIPCTSCSLKIDLKLTTIVIDITKQTSIWSFTLTNNGNSINSLYFTTLVLEDNTGQKHQGGGPASTDSWNMSSGQSIQTYATFDVVHGTNYLLNIALGPHFGASYQTETITF